MRLSFLLTRPKDWLVNLLFKKQQKNSQPTPNSIADVNKAMNELRLFSFQREVISSALTTIYEAEVKGILKSSERDKLAESYRKELELLDGKIEQRRKVAEFLNLRKEKKELQIYYSQKMTEIDKKIGELKSISGSFSLPNPALPQSSLEVIPDKKPSNSSAKPEKSENSDKTEKRIEALREEVLQAIDRLEQIESEG